MSFWCPTCPYIKDRVYDIASPIKSMEGPCVILEPCYPWAWRDLWYSFSAKQGHSKSCCVHVTSCWTHIARDSDTPKYARNTPKCTPIRSCPYYVVSYLCPCEIGLTFIAPWLGFHHRHKAWLLVDSWTWKKLSIILSGSLLLQSWTRFDRRIPVC